MTDFRKMSEGDLQRHMEETHPYIPDVYDKLKQGRVSRRDFLRMATLLGMSAGAATFMSACGTGTQPSEDSGGASSSGIKRGGSITTAMGLQQLNHPARLSWVEGANIVRQFSEYLTETKSDNITRPYLLESWDASDDVKTWTLKLRQNVTFNNGDKFAADDVMFTFGEWLNEETGSSMKGLLSYLSGMQDVEKVDDYTIVLHLQEANIGVPEHLFHYPAVILHRNFEGDIVKQPIGTGAFLLEEYAEGERAKFKRRPDYWRNGEDGQSLPYLDELIYVDIDKDAGVAAIQSGQVDALYQPRPSDWQALKDVDGIDVRSAGTAQCFLVRMRVDLEPWTDVRVRQALKMCQDREKILQLSYFGQGDLSIDAHVAPIHPAYAEKPIPEYDPDGAKALLTEAGFPDGLDVTLATKNDEAEPEIAQALKEMAAPAGFNITLDITEPGGYWERWAEVDLGITAWTHRPLDTMVLPLAYTANAEGVPVDWNETRWVDDEFTTLLRQAEGTLDVEKRRAIMSKIEDIFQDRGPIGNSYWKKVWKITRSDIKNVEAHPTSYDLYYEAWKDA